MTDKPDAASPIWHPFTQHGIEADMLEIASAHGAWLETTSGQRLFDAISSWWVTTHGHVHPRIVSAISRQAETLDQVIFAGTTHAPARAVADRLLAMVPTPLSHVFFSDSGSTAVEVALKMALGYWRNRGTPRHRIVALEHAYHGDTIGTMSAGARGTFNAAYAPLLFTVDRIPFPTVGHEQTSIDALERLCRDGNVAAFICEPLILGAGGMRTYAPEVLAALHGVCQRHNVLFIADEVMTGFGRTGKPFALNHAELSPDILCLAKGLTGGVVPLAVTLCQPDIYDAHLSSDRARMFFHSSSFTANPIACAAAAENLAMWQDEPVQARIDTVAAAQTHGLARIVDDPRIEAARQLGTITAFNLKTTEQGYLADVSLTIRRQAARRGVLLRPLGNVVYVMPPYCATVAELSTVYDVILDVLDEVTS